jgi:target of rapamycin complex subunit LST8
MNQQGVILATAGYDHCIRFWDATTGASTKVIRISDSQINALSISPDKRFIAAACNPCVKVFDLARPGAEGGQVAYLDVSFHA